MDVALQHEGNENGQALVEQLSLARNQPYRINFDLAILRKMRYSPCSYGFGLYGSIHAFFSNLRPEDMAPKALVFQSFLALRAFTGLLQHNEAQHY